MYHSNTRYKIALGKKQRRKKNEPSDKHFNNKLTDYFYDSSHL